MVPVDTVLAAFLRLLCLHGAVMVPCTCLLGCRCQVVNSATCGPRRVNHSTGHKHVHADEFCSRWVACCFFPLHCVHRALGQESGQVPHAIEWLHACSAADAVLGCIVLPLCYRFCQQCACMQPGVRGSLPAPLVGPQELQGEPGRGWQTLPAPPAHQRAPCCPAPAPGQAQQQRADRGQP